VTDRVLVLLGEGLATCTIERRRQPCAAPARPSSAPRSTRRLAPLGRKIGPDPASINAAKIGGIAANNASGMCCGTAQNSYNTLAAMRVLLADGTRARHRRRSQRGRLRSVTAACCRPWPPWAPDVRADKRPGRPHPPQVPDQEHHRLQPECAGGL
jgi:D-lactate dehydrogenase